MNINYSRFRHMSQENKIQILNKLNEFYQSNMVAIAKQGLGVNKTTLEKHLRENNIYFSEKNENFYYKNINELIDNIIERLEKLEAKPLPNIQTSNTYNIIPLKNKKLKTKTLKLDLEVEKKINELIGENGVLAGEKIQDVINTALIEFINKF